MTDDRVPFSLARIQRDFCNFLRDHEGNVRHESNISKSLNSKNLKLYRELVLENHSEILANCFRRTAKLLSIEKTEYSSWKVLVQQFVKEFNSTTLYFYEVPKAFLTFLNETELKGNYPPYLIELAHYEWVELALDIADIDSGNLPFDRDTSPIDSKPLLSPLAWPLQYHYPVHLELPKNGQLEQAQTYLVGYRDAENQIQFIEIDPLTALLLKEISKNRGLTGRECVINTIDQLDSADTQLMVDRGCQMLVQLYDNGIVLVSKS